MHAQQPNFALGSTGRAIEDHLQSHLPVVKFFLVSWVNTAIHRIPDLLHFLSLPFLQLIFDHLAVVGDKAWLRMNNALVI